MRPRSVPAAGGSPIGKALRVGRTHPGRAGPAGRRRAWSSAHGRKAGGTTGTPQSVHRVIGLRDLRDPVLRAAARGDPRAQLPIADLRLRSRFRLVAEHRHPALAHVLGTSTCGIDWAEGHHDVAVVGQDGKLIARSGSPMIPRGSPHWSRCWLRPAIVARPRSRSRSRRLVGVAALRATGRPAYAINPMAVARYRERTSVSRSKSDHADAMTVANTDETTATATPPPYATSSTGCSASSTTASKQDRPTTRPQPSRTNATHRQCALPGTTTSHSPTIFRLVAGRTPR